MKNLSLWAKQHSYWGSWCIALIYLIRWTLIVAFAFILWLGNFQLTHLLTLVPTIILILPPLIYLLAVVKMKPQPTATNKIFIIITACLLMGKATLSQSQDFNQSELARPFNNISLNAFGDASLGSINYERLFPVDSVFLLVGKLGIGFNEEFQLCIFGPCSPAPEKFLTIPHHFSVNIGKGKKFFEVGIGGTLLKSKSHQSYLLYPMIGYRFIPLRSNRTSFRIFLQFPFSGLESSEVVFIPFGINLGLSF